MDELVLRKYSGNDKIKTIQTLRELFALDLSEAKEIVDDLSSGTADANERTANANEKSAAYSEKIAKNTKSAARAAKLNAFINFMK